MERFRLSEYTPSYLLDLLDLLENPRHLDLIIIKRLIEFTRKTDELHEENRKMKNEISDFPTDMKD